MIQLTFMILWLCYYDKNNQLKRTDWVKWRLDSIAS